MKKKEEKNLLKKNEKSFFEKIIDFINWIKNRIFIILN
jgi:hypothetical protein